MAIIDLIGVPFPTTHPSFASDKQLQKKILQAENLIEMLHDMREAISHLNQLNKILDMKDKLLVSGIEAWTVGESLGASAVLMYAKVFVESQGRTQLQSDESFPKQTNLCARSMISLSICATSYLRIMNLKRIGTNYLFSRIETVNHYN